MSADADPARAQRNDLLRRIQRIGQTYLTTDVATLINYEHTPHGAVEHDFLTGAHRNLALLVQYLASDTAPTGYDVTPLVEIAVERHRQGVPLYEILAAYQDVAEAVWRRVLATTTTDEQAVLSTLTPRIVSYFTLVTATITAACESSAEGNPSTDRDEDRRAIAQALIDGTPPPLPNSSRTVRFPDRFVVIVVALEPTASSDAARSLLTALTAMDSYLVAHEHGWAALVPARDHPDGGVDYVRTMLTQGLPHDERVFVAGAAIADTHAQVPAAFAAAQALSAVNHDLGAANTLAVSTDLLLAHTIRTAHAIPPELRNLRKAIDALDDALTTTLIGFLAHDCNQLATAKGLHLHRNTVTYRLSRIATSTGTNPLTFAGAAALYAALALPTEFRPEQSRHG